MTGDALGPRKQRTREHIIADLRDYTESGSLAPGTPGERVGVRGNAYETSENEDPSPHPLSPEYRGEGLFVQPLSVHHVEGYILVCGHTAHRLNSDYGYDLVMITHDDHGYIEPGAVYLQLKAAESWTLIGSNYVYDLDVRDYNLWTRERMPVLLILYDAIIRRAWWVWVQEYFSTSRRPRPNAKTVRVRVPSDQRVNRKAVKQWRQLQQGVPRLWGE